MKRGRNWQTGQISEKLELSISGHYSADDLKRGGRTRVPGERKVPSRTRDTSLPDERGFPLPGATTGAVAKRQMRLFGLRKKAERRPTRRKGRAAGA